DFNLIALDLNYPNFLHRFTLAYIPPSKNKTFQEINKFSDIILDLASKSKFCTLIGDLNFPQINWVNGACSTASCELFYNFMSGIFNSQLIKEPTRKNHILDIMLTNCEDFFDNVKIGETLMNSDHRSIEFNINKPKLKLQRKKHR